MTKMKKGILAGLTVLLIGAVIFVASFATLGWNIYALDTAEYTEKHYEQAEDATPVTKLVIKVTSFNIEVTHGEKFALDYYEASDGKVTVTDENGVISVVEDRKFGCVNISTFNFGRLKYKYALTLPDNVELEVDSANIRLSLNGINASKVRFEGANSDLSVNDSVFAELTVSSSNCNLKITDTRAEKAEIHSSNLNATVKNSVFDSCKITGSNLDVDVLDTVSRILYVSGSNCDANILRVTADDITVHGSNLDADITLIGVKSEYTIESSGRKLPASQTGTDPNKKITLSGSNCSVDLSFVD